ncbi:Protein AE7 [Camellia lanceoleosa]|uniref:Protein AE7 n=1 Tax=Camellia lanceoleosa TaxID=1840588 RepID=A0ACC0GRL2_9ERIC|nr:Protein AE7 [Camellia lanceoleosa]
MGQLSVLTGGKGEIRANCSVRNSDNLDLVSVVEEDLETAAELRDIKDPEHPYSLEELKVITEDAIEVDNKHNCVRVTFTPTVEHCSMTTVIGLCLRVKLMRSLPLHYKVSVMDEGALAMEIFRCLAMDGGVRL